MLKSMIKSGFAKANQARARFTEFPLVEVPDRKAGDSQPRRIPRICFQTWASNAFGKTHAKGIAGFRNLNPDISFELYDNKRLFEYMRDVWHGHEILGVFESAIYGPMQADIFRYCILYDKGGYYFDINKACAVPLSSLHGIEDCALISYERNICNVLPDQKIMGLLQHPDRYVLQWGLGFERRHFILEAVISGIVENAFFFRGKVFQSAKDAVLALTGPGMFTRAMRVALSQRDDMSGIRQAGIDFNGHGVYSLPGGNVRYLQIPGYATARNVPILSD